MENSDFAKSDIGLSRIFTKTKNLFHKWSGTNMTQSVNSNAGMWTVNSHVNHLLKLIAMEWTNVHPYHISQVPYPTTIYRMLKFHRTRKNGNPIWIFVMKPLCRQKLVILKTRMHVPASTTLAWQFSLPHHRLWNPSNPTDATVSSSATVSDLLRDISIILADGP